MQRAALELVEKGRFHPDLVREADGWHARWRAAGATDNPWVDECVRAANVTPLSEDAENQRHETLHDAWIMALRSRTGLVRWDDAECAAFASELAEWHGGAEEDAAARASIRFTLGQSAGGLSLSCCVPRGRRAFKALGQAAYVFGPLRGLRMSEGLLSVALSRQEAEDFVRRGAGDLADAGYRVEGGDLAAEIAAEAEIVPAGPVDASAPSPSARLHLQVRVAGELVGADEIRFLLDQHSTLVFFRDRWIDIDRNILKEALRALERQDGRTLTANEALSFASGIGRAGRLDVAAARAHGWLRGLLNELRQSGGARARLPDAIPGLAGSLRPYQRRGAAWMKFLTDHGFGALLADDMGLGKTIQTIAWILASHAEAEASGAAFGPVLVVAPLTLLSNWRHEFAKFAPALRVYSHQGERRALLHGFSRAASESDVVVTSYSLLVKDYKIVRDVAWSALVLDEAQAIKNPDTQSARAARALSAPRRIALTGTPVENSAADVWSIEEFLNQGFLGDRKGFADRFVKPIAADERSAAGARLRHALEPFVLRRVKADAEIAGELGPKREIKEYCALSSAQRAEYEAALADWRAGERRHGDIFALITRLKLVCDGEGKFERLAALLEDVFAAGESALVFTQYAKVGAWLRSALEERFGRSFPFLHGGLDARQRDAEVARFGGEAGPSAFILSLRAGGFGLNLTKATHVVHFDRWWNPAVENQATDRAHRIGQTKTVFVHAFITEGTLEEHVDELLERKSRVAGSLVAGGEGFLRDLAPEEFDRVVSLE
ncbi:MAG: DEAD/DEAH box helicase family protein [Kiritimatiellae bacterium]|nr:DEAD/DEAH box helicase family protein [Kiritimatiellia bacterium]